MAPREDVSVEDHAALLRRLDRLADLMDSRWRIPGTPVRIGLDGIASIVPVLGDTLTAAVSLYLLAEARRLGISKLTLLRMLTNVGVDWAVGSVPAVGTLFDIAFKANQRNMDLLRRELLRRAAPVRQAGVRPEA